MKKIVLNCVPPFAVFRPSPPLSILKSWLTKYSFDSSIIYWNLLFNNIQKDFVWNNPKVLDTSNDLALYVNYVVCKSKNKKAYNGLKKLLEGFSPNNFNYNSSYYDEHMRIFAIKMDEIIDTALSKIDIIEDTMLWGFSIKMDGWIVSSIIADKIKRIAPNIPIVVGGINTKENAKAFLENFHQFDIAMWGEGEIALIELVEAINNGNNDYINVKNIAYRDKGDIVFSEKRNNQFMDLSEDIIYPNYDDYFSQKKGHIINHNIVVPIEGSRGCHWNRCKFCYLNTDYKYRLKSVEKICTEIKYMIDKYNVYEFEFLDNDFISLNLNRANELLDGLISIKKNEQRFKILNIEVVTKGLDLTIIKKMHLAGVIFAQIGYESTSQNLLKKIRKKNSFASNLFYVKAATTYSIPLYNVNVITNMPDETVEDIMESTDNLRFLRFFLHPINFRHFLLPVQVNSISKYYAQVKDENAFWTTSMMAYEFLKDYIAPKYHWDIFSFIKQTKHYQWDTFKRIEKFYLDNKHTYSIENEKNIIKYCEYVKGRKILELDIAENSLDAKVLHCSNTKVVSLDDMTIVINNISIHQKYSSEDIKDVVNNFFAKNNRPNGLCKFLKRIVHISAAS